MQVGVLSVVLSGVLTIFFRGLLELSKTFLDPFGNAERHHEDDFRQSIATDALISEVNAASTRWWRGAERLPFDTIYVESERARNARRPPTDALPSDSVHIPLAGSVEPTIVNVNG